MTRTSSFFFLLLPSSVSFFSSPLPSLFFAAFAFTFLNQLLFSEFSSLSMMSAQTNQVTDDLDLHLSSLVEMCKKCRYTGLICSFLLISSILSIVLSSLGLFSFLLLTVYEWSSKQGVTLTSPEYSIGPTKWKA